MKKGYKFVAGLMGLALLGGPLMTACNTSITYEAVKIGNINAPDYVVVGDVFNLDDYITIDGGAGPKIFDATINTISEGVATIKGHQVTVLTEGTISIAITVGPKGEEPLWRGKFSTKSISALKASYQEYTKDITDQFMFYSIEADQKTGEYYAEELIKHTHNYVWFSQWEYEDQKLGTIKSGGIMRSGNGYTHFFSIDSTGKNLEVEVERLTDLQYYYVAQDFSLPTTSFETQIYTDEETGASEEFLYAGYSKEVDEFVKYNVGLSWNERYVTHSINAYPIVDPFSEGKGEVYWEYDIYVAYASAPKVATDLGAMLILSAKDEDCKVDLLEKYIENKDEPDEIECDDIGTALDKVIAAKNYTLTTDVSMFYYNGNTEVPLAGNAIDAPGLNVINGSHEVVKVNETSVCSVFTTPDEEVVKTGAYEKDGKVYTYAPAADDASKIVAEESEDLTAVWASDNTYTVAPLASTNTEVYDDAFRVNGKEVKNGVTTYTIAGNDVIMFASCFLSQSMGGNGFAYRANKYDADYPEDESFWAMADITLVLAESYIELTLTSPWLYVDEKGETLGYIKIEMRISNIGTTAANDIAGILGE